MDQARIAELGRERRVIRAWIRDVTAEKQARLMQIRAELRAIYNQNPAKPNGTKSVLVR